MSLTDALLLAATVAFALWRLLAPPGPRLRLVAGLALAVLAVVQVLRDGPTWQFAPAYVLILAAAAPLSGRGPITRWLGRLVLTGLMLATLGTWALLPVPVLPQPDGPYPVGTQVFRWVDASRPETATADPSDRRNVIVQAWYPTTPGAAGPHSAYIDGVGRLPPNVSGVPRIVMTRFGRIDTRATLDAPLSAARRTWPVVVFSPGYGAPRAFYTGIVGRLASRGYVVLALDHAYESGVTQLADGRVVGNRPPRASDDGGRIGYMEDQILVRLADLRFTLDQLGRPQAMGAQLAGRLDLDHIAAIGHSFGGATSVLAAQQDARIKAAADIDGALYADVWRHALPKPFLLLESDHAKSHDARYMARTKALLAQATAGAGRFEIKHADHVGFTDAPLYASPPGHLAFGWFVGGPREPAETHAATVDILDAFLRGPLGGRPADLGAVAARYRGITGGPAPAAASPESRRPLGLADRRRDPR